MLLGGELVHQQVGVVDDEPTEDQRPGAGEDQLCCFVVEKQPHNTADDQNQQSSKQPCSQLAEVSLGLEGVGRQTYEHRASQEERLEHDFILIKAHSCCH